MRIRPYIESRDYEYIEKWVDNEKIHALWCANLIPYPVTKENLHAFLEKTAIEWTDSAYVATETNGKVIGFSATLSMLMMIQDLLNLLWLTIICGEKAMEKQ